MFSNFVLLNEVSCWVEHLWPLTYVVILRYDSILKRVFANILVAFRFEYISIYGLYFLKNFIFILLLSFSQPQCIKHNSPVLEITMGYNNHSHYVVIFSFYTCQLSQIMVCWLWCIWSHDTLPRFPILSCETKSACLVEHVRLLTYVVLLRYDWILKGVFANILVAFRVESKRWLTKAFIDKRMLASNMRIGMLR